MVKSHVERFVSMDGGKKAIYFRSSAATLLTSESTRDAEAFVVRHGVRAVLVEGKWRRLGVREGWDADGCTPYDAFLARGVQKASARKGVEVGGCKEDARSGACIDQRSEIKSPSGLGHLPRNWSSHPVILDRISPKLDNLINQLAGIFIQMGVPHLLRTVGDISDHLLNMVFNS